MLIKVLIHQYNVTILNVHAPNNTALKYIKQNLIQLEGEIKKSRLKLVNFNTVLPVIMEVQDSILGRTYNKYTTQLILVTFLWYYLRKKALIYKNTIHQYNSIQCTSKKKKIILKVIWDVRARIRKNKTNTNYKQIIFRHVGKYKLNPVSTKW